MNRPVPGDGVVISGAALGLPADGPKVEAGAAPGRSTETIRYTLFLALALAIR